MATEGAHEAPTILTEVVTEYLSSVTTIVAYAGFIWTLSPALLGALVITALPLSVVHRSMGKRAFGMVSAAAENRRWSDYYWSLFTDPAAAKEMRVFNSAGLLQRKFRKYLASALQLDVAQHKQFAMVQVGYTGIVGLITAGGSWYVVTRVASQGLPVGSFVLFGAAAVALQTRFASLIGLTSQLQLKLATFGVYLELCKTLTYDRAAPSELRETPPLEAEIRFDDVWFRYDALLPWVLKGVTLRIQAGKTHGLVGVNGVGKTTLIHMLMRLHDPDKGAIYWDGIDIRSFEPSSLRGRLACVFQQPVRYELSVLDNITVGEGRQFGDLCSAQRAAKHVGFQRTVMALPNGYATMLSSRRRTSVDADPGVMLSGGQWQRLAIARAAIRDRAHLFILDEPNAGLDIQAEVEVREALFSTGQGRTQILVSHHFQSLMRADIVSVLGDGRVIESGTPEQLCRTESAFAELYSDYIEPKRAT